MKAIISHDVDHLTVREHNFDLIVPKYILRSGLEWALGYVFKNELFERMKGVWKNRWQNLDSLLEFDRENKVPSVFFVGTAKGRGLRYELDNARFWIKRIVGEGFEAGVHGIAYDDLQEMRKEHFLFSECSGKNNFGIRMHYLMGGPQTLDFLENCGYLYDTSIRDIRAPFKKNNIWEFPLTIMDGDIFYRNSRWQNQTLRDSKESTKRILKKCHQKGMPFISVLFHDRYFSGSFRTWMDWYVWIIGYLRENGIPLVNYSEAISELENEKSAQGQRNPCESLVAVDLADRTGRK